MYNQYSGTHSENIILLDVSVLQKKSLSLYFITYYEC